MKKSRYYLSLELHDVRSPIMMNAMQNDYIRSLQISLSDCGQPFSIADDCTALLRVKKEGGILDSFECIIENNVIVCDLPEDATSDAGVLQCEILLTDSNSGRLTSPKFEIRISES